MNPPKEVEPRVEYWGPPALPDFGARPPLDEIMYET